MKVLYPTTGNDIMKSAFIIITAICLLSPLYAVRKALVIGNAEYSTSALRNPVNDARKVEATLQKLGFEVTLKTNLDKRHFDTAINAFTTEIQPTDEVLFYYSGHGTQVEGENFLIPVGIEIVDEIGCKYDAVNCNGLIERLHKAALSIIVLDACRDNPYKGVRSGNKGLAAMECKAGSQYIIYSTERGKTATDGSGSISPFTEVFTAQALVSDRTIEEMMRDVVSEVKEKTEGRQIPFSYGNLEFPFYFAGAGKPREPKPAEPAVIPQIEKTYTYGSIQIESNADAEIYLDGIFLQRIKQNETTTINKVVCGSHKVELRLAKSSKILTTMVKKAKVAAVSFNFEKKDTDVLVYVEAWTFSMGDAIGDGFYDELPKHRVTIPSFYIGRYEVTQIEWEKIMGCNPSGFKGDTLPVESVSWYDCVEFCNKLSRKEGLTPVYDIDKSRQDSNNQASEDKLKWIVTADWSANGYRLPTEAEWEFAARGGKESRETKYSGSNNLSDVAWFKDNTDNTTQPVGQKQPNELGIYDMSGNVREWCWDWYNRSYYKNSGSTNPLGAERGSSRALRGGSWYLDSYPSRITLRDSNYPDYKSNGVGLRFCRSMR